MKRSLLLIALTLGSIVISQTIKSMDFVVSGISNAVAAIASPAKSSYDSAPVVANILFQSTPEQEATRRQEFRNNSPKLVALPQGAPLFLYTQPQHHKTSAKQLPSKL